MTESKAIFDDLFSGKFIINTEIKNGQVHFILYKKLIFGIKGSKVRGFSIQRQRLERGIIQNNLIDWDGYTDYCWDGFKVGMTNTNVDIAYLGIGLAGETGEFIEHIKKFVWHKKKMDRIELAAEGGDILWHLANALRWCGITLQQCIDANQAKLNERYKNGRQDLTFRDTKIEYKIMEEALNGGHK